MIPQKPRVNLFFHIEFFKYFFRVLHEASSSWLKLFRVFRLHPVYFDFRITSMKHHKCCTKECFQTNNRFRHTNFNRDRESQQPPPLQ
jgi:hypothetical protein